LDLDWLLGRNPKLMRVLLVTSNPGRIRAMREISNVKDFAWIVAGRLSEAITRVHSEAFDLVLLDIALPDSRGVITYKKFQAAAPDMAVVVVASPDQEEWALSALREGAQDFIILREDQKTLHLKGILTNAKQRKTGLMAVQGGELIDKLTNFYTYEGFRKATNEELKAARVVKRKMTLFMIRTATIDDVLVAAAADVIRHMLAKLDLHGCTARFAPNELGALLPLMSDAAFATSLRQQASTRIPEGYFNVEKVQVDSEMSPSIEPSVQYLRQQLDARAFGAGAPLSSSQPQPQTA